MQGTITFHRDLVIDVWPCPNCGIEFGVPHDFDKRRREDGKAFYCPNGHSMTYDSEIAELRKRQAVLERQVTEARSRNEQVEREKSALKGQITKARKRAAAGVCPCCKRSFVQMERHMKSQHPGYVAEAAHDHA